MVLLIWLTLPAEQKEIQDLHSSMVLLISDLCVNAMSTLGKFTFQYGSTYIRFVLTIVIYSFSAIHFVYLKNNHLIFIIFILNNNNFLINHLNQLALSMYPSFYTIYSRQLNKIARLIFI